MASYTPPYNWVGFSSPLLQQIIRVNWSLLTSRCVSWSFPSSFWREEIHRWLVPTSPIAGCVAGKKMSHGPSVSWNKIMEANWRNSQLTNQKSIILESTKKWIKHLVFSHSEPKRNTVLLWGDYMINHLDLLKMPEKKWNVFSQMVVNNGDVHPMVESVKITNRTNPGFLEPDGQPSIEINCLAVSIGCFEPKSFY